MSKKILFIIDLIKGGGGAQKILKIAMQTLSQNGYDISLAVLKKSQDELDFSQFKTSYILNSTDQLLPNSFIILHKLTDLIKQNDTVCVFIDFITVYYASLAHSLASQDGHKAKFICFVRTHLSHMSQNFPDPKLNLSLEKLALQKADKVVANSQFSKNDLINLGIKNVKILLNPYDKSLANKGAFCPNFNYAIAIGRLAVEKDYETMIKAFKLANIKDLWLIILGDGGLEDELKELAKGANIEFVGYQKDTSFYLRNAKFFIQTSLFEGLSNSVLESYALGIPAVLSDIEPNKEIYKDDGIYAPCKDILAFSKALILANSSYKFKPNLDKFSLKNFETKLLRIVN